MVKRNRDRIVALIHLKDKVSLGFVKGLNIIFESYSVGPMGGEMKNISSQGSYLYVAGHLNASRVEMMEAKGSL